MPKSKQRKKKNRKQLIPVEVRIPVGTQQVERDGKIHTETIIAKVKTRQFKMIKHLPQKH